LLTEREREVALAVGQGRSNADIARELYVTVATVKAHVSRLLSKLEARTASRSHSSYTMRPPDHNSSRERGLESALGYGPWEQLREENFMSETTTRRPDTRLTAIAGRWRTSGHVIGDPQIPVVGTDIYEVLPGGHFLVHHVDVTVGSRSVRAIEIIGEPAGEGGYLARSYDNEGNAEVMHLRIHDDGVFHFAGGGEIATAAHRNNTPTARVRSALTVASDRASMTAWWERSEDGVTWQPWMEIAFARDE
jgi:Bacterial regulatory proteins, luxR family